MVRSRSEKFRDKMHLLTKKIREWYLDFFPPLLHEPSAFIAGEQLPLKLPTGGGGCLLLKINFREKKHNHPILIVRIGRKHIASV